MHKQQVWYWSGKGVPSSLGLNATQLVLPPPQSTIQMHLMCSTKAAWWFAALCKRCSSSPCPFSSFMLALYSGWKRESASLQAAGRDVTRERGECSGAGKGASSACCGLMQSDAAPTWQ